MNYTQQVLFALGAIGVINSLIVSLYFLTAKTYSSVSNHLMGAFLLVLSLRILKSIFYTFSTEEPIWFLQSGPAFFCFIGPLMFLYLMSLMNPGSFWVRTRTLHQLFWLFVFVALIFLFPFPRFRELNKTVILPAINMQWLVYILWSSLYYILSIKKSRTLSLQSRWVGIFLLANLIVWGSFSLINFRYFISGSIVFSVLFYAAFLFFLSNKRVADKVFVKMKAKKIAFITADAALLLQRLRMTLESEQLFLNPNFKIADLAEKLNVSTHELSRVLNEHLGESFSEVVNKYRVEEAKRLMLINTQYTVEAIGNLAGFNSKSAFYKAFRAYAKTTPAKYVSSSRD